MKQETLSSKDLMVAALTTNLLLMLIIASSTTANQTPISFEAPSTTRDDNLRYLNSHQNYEANDREIDLFPALSSIDETNIRGVNSEDSAEPNDHGEPIDDSQDIPERNLFVDRHNSQIQRMQELFQRRQLNNHHHQLQSSQELNPIAIGLDQALQGGNSPFNIAPFSVPNHEVSAMPPQPQLAPELSSPEKPPSMSNADIGGDQGVLGPFGLNQMPHLFGFQNSPFNGPQRGDQSAHSDRHAAMPPVGVDGRDSDATSSALKVWPKIFRFTDGRINLSEFEKHKKIRLSNKSQRTNDNHIETAPVIFDGRQLKRKSFLILHGGIFA